MGDYSFIDVKGDHNFPVDETLIYQWSQSKSGWTGFFVFMASVVIGAITGALTGGLGLSFATSILESTLAGAAGGAFSGLVATDFSPTTNVTAKYPGLPLGLSGSTTYQLDPSSGMGGDAKEIANRTLDQWLKPEVQSTPGGVSVFVSKIDFRRAVLCGSASKATDSCTENPSSSVVNIPMGDSRFKSVFEEMFSNPTKDLMKYKYPYQGR